MAGKPLGKDSMGIQKTMRLGDYLGDGLGQLPLNVMANLVGQLTYFYTEKVGLAAGMVATMLLAAKFADAFSDLVMGKIMDMGNSPKGKCRPWFLRMAIPAAVIIIMLFTVPKNAPGGLQMGYVLITNILLSAVVYTAVAIPYGAIMAIRTESVEERGRMGIVRTIFGYVIGMVIAILLIPITNMLGGDQGAWIKVSVVFAVLSAASLFILYKTSRETSKTAAEEEPQDTEEKVPFAEAIRMLFQNKYWVIMLLVNLLVNISYGLSTGGGTYFAKYILGNDNLVALLGAVGLLPTFIGFIIVGPMTKKLGMAGACKVSALIGAVAMVVRAFTPYSIVTTVGCGLFSSFATIPMMCLTAPMVNNCVEYNDWKYGKRMVGMTNSASSFGGKIGSGIGGSLIGWLLALAGYNAAAASQPGSVNIAIFAFAIYIPLGLFVIMAVLFHKYDLEKHYVEIVTALKERKAGK
ncbi:MFS transporter [Schaedlerella arabinosiphila]|uniref:MFS transporter n=1 Tax=Schaedlerella arabinosiphila TaxID=2044587 RepID=N2B7V2_9FIRM|nr:glycoside-pentoside-hexuronide (GPH):cation symporter [Schaedlerella arabinosiphila]MCI9213563.1 MFS transporter [Ruminococcus sp.]KAI4439306.1 Isoprimeverose transporter [Schaedlerella arabinosiphila]MCI9602763.1 MFS transporter [Ruminococcus sp.]MCI9633613.1 MFS transporter [Ruminococcus sp.]RRK30824.1 MFS transporter [Schaedlerella arabinosiphila]